MQDILFSMPVLLVSMGMNILLGLYYQVGIRRAPFQLRRLVDGAAKAGVVGLAFIGLAFCFDRIDLSSLGISPCIIMHSAICLYIGKVAAHLTKILGVSGKKDGGSPEPGPGGSEEAASSGGSGSSQKAAPSGSSEASGRI